MLSGLVSARFFHLIPMALLLALVVCVRLFDPTPISNLRLSVFDQYLRMAPRIADPTFPVKIVAIDEASLARLGQWPWPRSLIARLVDKLGEAGAKSIVFDVILAEPDRMTPGAVAGAFSASPEFETVKRLAARLPSNDELLATALSKSPSVMGFSASDDVVGALAPASGIAAKGDDPETFVAAFGGAVSSLRVLVDAARGLGAVNWIPDRDQVLRRVPLLIRVNGNVYPSLSLEALRVGEDGGTILYVGSGGSGARAFGEVSGIEIVKLGARLLPTNQRGEMWLRFSKRDSRRYISAVEVLDESFDGGLVKGRHVFFGATAAGLLDLRATPLARAVPGVEVHAQALEQMLSGEHLVRPSYALGLELAFLLGAGLLVAWLIGIAGPAVAALVGAVAILGVNGLSWSLFAGPGVLFDAVYPSIALAGLYVVGSLTSYIRSERERSRVRAAFGNYVAPQLVEELANDPSKLKLGGETREVTVLFSDVRDFSGMAEKLDAEGLIAFVNRLFTPLADVILEERGTIDKFMGDAVMAFWNAPVVDRDHARQACRAALRMRETLDSLNRTWKRDALASGEVFEPVEIGIGLNTGPCCVGNVGSPQRFDYSILGDVVNVAARLETATKTYGAGIMVGERLMEVADGFAFLELDRVALKGRSEVQPVFALLGDETMCSSQAFKRLKAAHGTLLGAVRLKAWEEAQAALLRCESCGVGSYGPIASYFRRVVEKG